MSLPITKLFGANVKKIRKLRNMTQNQRARAANLTPTAIRHMESGNNYPSAASP